jgi:hypothetical protein
LFQHWNASTIVLTYNKGDKIFYNSNHNI